MEVKIFLQNQSKNGNRIHRLCTNNVGRCKQVEPQVGSEVGSELFAWLFYLGNACSYVYKSYGIGL